jgi:hypothetical protein
MASDLQKGQRESKASFGILAASLFISMVASLVLIVGSAKIETIALTSNHKDRIFSEKYLKYLKKWRIMPKLKNSWVLRSGMPRPAPSQLTTILANSLGESIFARRA